MQKAPVGIKVRALVSAFEKGKELPQDPTTRVGAIKSYLHIPDKIARHAVNRRVSFVGFINSTAHSSCMTRSTWLKTVEDWRDSFYRTGGQRVSEFAQEEDDVEFADNIWTGQKNRGNIWQMYVGVPEEKDTYGIEALLRLCLR